MDCMTPNGTMEGTLVTALRNSWVVAISDLLDDGKSSDRIVDEQTSTSHGLESNPQPQQKQQHQQQQQQAKVETISKMSHCSPYDTLYWLGGDCMRATSLAPIAECTTMKTDNTSELNVVSPDAKDSRPVAVSPESPTTTTAIINETEEPLPQQQILYTMSDTNDDTPDIIAQYRKRHENPKALFDSKEDHMDYNDPLNSLIVEDSNTEESNTYSQPDKIHTEYLRKSKSKTNNDNSSNMFCVKTTIETESEDWGQMSTASWCGGYPSLLMYSGNNEDDDNNNNKKNKLKNNDSNSNSTNTIDPTAQRQPEEQYPEYYAEFKPQRTYAFDEEDSNSGSTRTPTREVIEGVVSMDGVSTVAETARSNDNDSLVTGASSVQSFMVINRPHTKYMQNNSTPLARKLQRGSSNSRRVVTPDFDRHLHKLIASPTRSMTTADSEAEHANPMDHALSQSLMRKLQKHLPYCKRGDSFWLQYSLIRDGASLDSLLKMVHKDASQTSNHICSVLAIETLDGEVFGAFLTQTWKRSHKEWYGGGQSFLWTTTESSSKKSKKLRVFPYSFENSYVQLCDRDRLVVGGGDGFGLALESDLLQGSSCPCTTFDSPSLSKIHSDGSTFEVRNVEVWTLTPCLSVIENPSEGLVRVHKKEAEKKRKQEKAKLKAPKQDSTDKEDDLKDFYDCAPPNCSNTYEIENLDLASSSFPGAEKDTIEGGYSSQRRKSQNKYVFHSDSM